MDTADVGQWGVSLRWVLAVVVFGTVVSTAAAARTGDFRDEFTSLDATRWTLVDRQAGRGRVVPANVGVAGGQLAVKLPAGTLQGGEIRTNAAYRFGTYRARMKIADAPSALTAFYLYGTPDYAREIDIELFNDSSRRIMFTTYSGGAQTNTRTHVLPFDPRADFHVYEIDYRPGSVRFLVDGAVLQEWSKGVTRAAMNLFVTVWFPSWLEGTLPASDRTTYVDWIDFVSR